MRRYSIYSLFILNAISSIGLVFVSKYVFRDHGFSYGVLLTIIQFLVTFVLLLLCLLARLFSFKRLPLHQVLPLCACYCGFTCLGNLSLYYNSVGVYQLMRVLIIPVLVAAQTYIYYLSFPSKVKAALACMCTGVALATVSDVESNIIGAITALAAVLLTCQYQIWVSIYQASLKCNSFQLLLYIAPISAVMLIPCSFIVDDLPNEFFMPCRETVQLLLLSGILFFGANVTLYLVIQKTSPVTYNVLSHVNMCAVLLMGIFLFDGPMMAKQLLGIVLALAGVFWYATTMAPLPGTPEGMSLIGDNVFLVDEKVLDCNKRDEAMLL